jgi:hypothetical protein
LWLFENSILFLQLIQRALFDTLLGKCTLLSIVHCRPPAFMLEPPSNTVRL